MCTSKQQNDIRRDIRKTLTACVVVLCMTSIAWPANGQTFTRITDGAIGANAGNTFGASWVDFDGDGDLDLFSSNAATLSGNLVYQNEGDGQFTRITEGVLANDPGIAVVGSCWADYDNDGDLDVFNAGVPNSFLYRNDGQTNFTKITSGDIGDGTDRRGWSCAWGDYNEDGHLDLFVAHPANFLGPPAPNALFKNNGNGTFTRINDTPITDGLAPYTVGNWIDYDEDGDIDLFIGSGPAVGTVDADFLFKNELSETGTASFVRITDLPLNDDRDGQTWNFIDFDNDGDRDGYVTNYWGGFTNGMANDFYENNSGIFTEVTNSPLATDEAFSLANVWADFDNDGNLDVFVTNEFGNDNVYYRNGGAPGFAFTATDDFAGTTQSNYGATAGDFDFDGDLDLFFPSGQGGGNHFYRNDSPAGKAWINIKLAGTASNATGVAAKVRTRAIINGKPVWQQREVSTQNTFNGHNSLNVHFGLGNAGKVTTLEITWPSGRVETRRNVTVNTFYVAVEGDQLMTMAEYLLRTLKDRVEALLLADVLGENQAADLRGYLNQAISKVAAGNDRVGASLIRAYEGLVKDLASNGTLAAADEKDLLDPAGNAQLLLDNHGTPGAAEAERPAFAASADLPESFELAQNRPNPFNPSTTIAFALPEETHVRLAVYDMQGRRIASLIDGTRSAGRHEVRWEAQGLASGMYLYRIEAGTFSQSKLLHLLK